MEEILQNMTTEELIVAGVAIVILLLVLKGIVKALSGPRDYYVKTFDPPRGTGVHHVRAGSREEAELIAWNHCESGRAKVLDTKRHRW